MTDPAGSPTPAPLDASFYERDPTLVAPDILGRVLVVGDATGRIVEVEAYRGADDPAAHTHRGPTPRTATMFGPPGGLYVYFSYGMHWCANAVCGPVGVGDAVLIRALAPLTGLADMRARRPAARIDRDLCSGPAKLCAALGLTGDDDGRRLTEALGRVRIVDDGWREDAGVGAHVVQTTRIGISKAADRPWRWHLDDPNVSRAAPGV